MSYAFDTSLLHLLHRSSQVAADLFAAAEGADGLTPRQYVVLAAFAEHDGISQTTVIARSGVDRSTIAGIVKRLTRDGFLRRRRSAADGRAYVVTITPAGRQHLSRAQRSAQHVNRTMLAKLDKSDGEHLLRCLTSISDPTAFTSTS